MRLFFVIKFDYTIGQIINVAGTDIQVAKFLETGNFYGITKAGKQVLCIVSDAQPIVEIPAQHVVDERSLRGEASAKIKHPF